MDTPLPPLPPELPRDAHKGTAGRILVLAGSAWMPGAAVLCVRAAQRAGAGLVTLACTDDVLRHVTPIAAPETVLAAVDEVDFGADGWHAGVVGPGLGLAPRSVELVRAFVARFRGPIVVDADALTVCAGEPELLTGRGAATIVTPHPGEAARLLARSAPVAGAERVDAARAIARRYRAVCCLKGAGTVVTDGERTYVNDTGNPGMATAGSGDVLAGVAAAYVAVSRALPSAEFAAYEAALAAVHVHGRAGDLAAERLGRRGLVASDLVEALPAAQRR